MNPPDKHVVAERIKRVMELTETAVAVKGPMFTAAVHGTVALDQILAICGIVCRTLSPEDQARTHETLVALSGNVFAAMVELASLDDTDQRECLRLARMCFDALAVKESDTAPPTPPR